MLSFRVVGPFDAPTFKAKAAKIIATDALDDFWTGCDGLGEERGCYVFGIRAGQGIKPFYVGKATRNFRQETFAAGKLAKYQRCLADVQRGTPVLFFVVHPKTRGTPNRTAISELEEFLIQTAVARNPRLLNVQGTKRAEWGIAGLVRSGGGTRSASAELFNRALNVSKP